ncbi:Rab-like protein 2B, partial [Ophiophagus hannah]
MHASYYHKAHACIMVFDVQRKVTYKNLTNWYKELPDLKATQKSFNFPKKLNLPLYIVSAADGTNVVKVVEGGLDSWPRGWGAWGGPLARQGRGPQRWSPPALQRCHQNGRGLQAELGGLYGRSPEGAGRKRGSLGGCLGLEAQRGPWELALGRGGGDGLSGASGARGGASHC